MKSDIQSQGEDQLRELELIILQKAGRFFESSQAHLEELVEIITGKTKTGEKTRISIRLIDWFTSNYSKVHNTKYILKTLGIRHIFRVNEEYTMEMKAYKKKCFDPFCRKRKVLVRIKNAGHPSVRLSTSVGQLNFFHWAIRNNVIRYISMHIDQIEEHMRTSDPRPVEPQMQPSPKIDDPRNPCELCYSGGLKRLNLTDPMPQVTQPKLQRAPKETAPITIRRSKHQ